MSNRRQHLECFLIEMAQALIMCLMVLFVACVFYWLVFSRYIMEVNQEIIWRQMTWASAFPRDTFWDWWVWEVWGKPASIMTGCFILGITALYLIWKWFDRLGDDLEDE